jgi:hypothetical protein
VLLEKRKGWKTPVVLTIFFSLFLVLMVTPQNASLMLVSETFCATSRCGKNNRGRCFHHIPFFQNFIILKGSSFE